ncbi:MAG: hypothetical protein KatS3mg114_0779 [Planctomycetaceae bacterium]|nr:MAG: hypothetical protein KatS3mg114_0779 [Planctomycetaceae bacterium]
MADLRGFDAQTVEPNDSFDPIPNGDYLCIITTSEMKPTKAGDGAYLELELQVIEGPYQGRKLWDRLNLNNANETTVKIAKGTLSAICRAVGVLQPTDSCELHDLPLVAKVACRKRDDTEELTNVIKSYKKRDAVATTPASSPAPAKTAATSSTPPWKRA